MSASDHTLLMVQWWRYAGIEQADLAVRRSCGHWLWHEDIHLEDLVPGSPLLSWVRAENVRCADVYVQPAKGYSWPLVFLDDVPVSTASRASQKYDALVVKTSNEGGCHLWLTSTCYLDKVGRHNAQKWLARKAGADLFATSGVHLGRLAGFKNWKRGGTWVNVLDAPRRGRRWNAEVTGLHDKSPEQACTKPRHDSHRSIDTTDSGREWGWVCRMLEAGYDPRRVYHRLVERSFPRRGKDTERYARRTIDRAVAHVKLIGRKYSS